MHTFSVGASRFSFYFTSITIYMQIGQIGVHSTLAVEMQYQNNGLLQTNNRICEYFMSIRSYFRLKRERTIHEMESLDWISNA